MSKEFRHGNIVLKVGDRFRLNGKWEYVVKEVEAGERVGQLIARGINLHHTELLAKMDLEGFEKI